MFRKLALYIIDKGSLLLSVTLPYRSSIDTQAAFPYTNLIRKGFGLGAFEGILNASFRSCAKDRRTQAPLLLYGAHPKGTSQMTKITRLRTTE